jgi:hypothetical protein
MKTNQFFIATVCAFVIFIGLIEAQAQSGRAEVQGILGVATYSVGGGAPFPLRKGAAIPAGSVVKTGRESALDLYLGPDAGTIRLTQNSILSLEKLDRSQTRLALQEGSMVGWGAKIPTTSEFQVKLPNGIVGIVEGRYRLDARSYLVLLNGTMVYAFISSQGEATPYTMKAPPAVYFSPAEGVKPAPPQLQREVDLQSKGKLR